jgi:pimeloyl-ACP methyl ester carboxylesterase
VALRRAVAASKTFDRRRTVVDGTVIEWRRSTTRPRRPDLPVVLLPGVSLSGRYLLPLAAELDGDFPVHLPDPPGFAGSDAPEAGMAMEAQADVLASWMSAIGVSRAHVIANSMGCQIATHLAVRHPRRVAGLVLQGPTVDPQSRSLMGQLGRLVLDALQEPVSIGPSHLFDWARSGPRAAAPGAPPHRAHGEAFHALLPSGRVGQDRAAVRRRVVTVPVGYGCPGDGGSVRSRAGVTSPAPSAPTRRYTSSLLRVSAMSRLRMVS